MIARVQVDEAVRKPKVGEQMTMVGVGHAGVAFLVTLAVVAVVVAVAAVGYSMTDEHD